MIAKARPPSNLPGLASEHRSEGSKNEPKCIEHAPWKLLGRLALRLGAITTSTPKLPRCRASGSDWLEAGPPGLNFSNMDFASQGANQQSFEYLLLGQAPFSKYWGSEGFSGACWLRNGVAAGSVW